MKTPHNFIAPRHIQRDMYTTHSTTVSILNAEHRQHTTFRSESKFTRRTISWLKNMHWLRLYGGNLSPSDYYLFSVHKQILGRTKFNMVVRMKQLWLVGWLKSLYHDVTNSRTVAKTTCERSVVAVQLNASYHYLRRSDGAVCWGTTPQDRRSRFRFPAGSIEFFEWPNPSVRI
jgi:hypothetical protein